jgi:hypothetical protein
MSVLDEKPRGTTLPVAMAAMVLSVVCGLYPGLARAAASHSEPLPATSPALRRNLVEKTPLLFVPNQGQLPSEVLYATHTGSLSVDLGRSSIVLYVPLAAPSHGQEVSTRPSEEPAAQKVSRSLRKIVAPRVEQERIEFLGANPNVALEPEDMQVARVNYFLGNQPSRWVHGLKTYAQLRYKNLYPGIDLVFYGKNGKLEYDFVVAPGADPSQIRLRFTGDQPPTLDELGNLTLTKDGALGFAAPFLYQNLQNAKSARRGRFSLLANSEIGFSLGKYDPNKSLAIDPTLTISYSTFMGGVHDDGALAISVDSSGNAYIAGYSASEDFPVTANAYQATRTSIGQYVYNAVIMKFDPSGTLLYSTYLGGGGGAVNDAAESIVVDQNGDAWVGGVTVSPQFPVTNGAFQSAFGGNDDAFLSELSPDGSNLLYSTYLGGPGNEFIRSMLLNADGSFWIAGGASAAGIPSSPNAYQSAPKGNDNQFIAKVVPSGNNSIQIPYLTFFGGSAQDSDSLPFTSLATDSSGDVYLAATTQSNDFPSTPNALQSPAQICQVNSQSIATCESNLQPNSEAFVAQFSPDLSHLLYASEIGGKTVEAGYGTSGWNFPTAVHADGAGNIWVVGTTDETDMQVTQSAILSSLHGGSGKGGSNVFVNEISADGTKLLYGSYLGSTAATDHSSNAVWDSNGNIWITGDTVSLDYPYTTTIIPPVQPDGINYPTQIFLTELSPDGSKILYSTYLATGNGNIKSSNSYQDSVGFPGCGDSQQGVTAENCNYDGYGPVAIGIDSSGNFHLAGSTNAAFTITPNALQTQFARGDANPDGEDMFYSILSSGSSSSVAAYPLTLGNGGDGTITVTGTGFQQGATCELVQGGTTITAAVANVSANGTSVTCTFNLTGATTGSYQIVVANPNGGNTFTAAIPLTIETGQGPALSVNLIGRSAIRVNTPTQFALTVSNTGDANAYLVWVDVGYPMTATLTFSYSPMPPLPNGTNLDYSSVPQTYTQGNTVHQVLILPILNAGSISTYDFQILDGTLGDNATVTASAVYGATTLSTPGNPNPLDRRPWELPVSAGSLIPHAGTSGLKPLSCFNDFVGVIGNAFGVNGCVAATTLSVLTSTFADGYNANGPNPAVNFGNYAWWLAQQALVNCASRINPIVGVMAQIYSAGKALTDCGVTHYIANTSGGRAILLAIKSAIDPNEKDGSAGDGSAARYIRSEPLSYNLAFENEPTATAPAAKVVVTDQLDPTKVDLSTVTLGPIQFGGNVITPSQGSTNYSTLYSINSSLSVDIQGSLNAQTGLMTWSFASIDPSTGLPPTDPSVGFLPPDVNGIQGQGSVIFNVMPKAGLSTGTAISNMASVVFDSNAPINTAAWTNTLDVTPPQSHV